MGIFKKVFAKTTEKEQGKEVRTGPETGVTDSPHPKSGPWTGVDLDGTLAVWDAGSSLDRIGPPVPAMLSYVRRMVDNGIRVKIFTARASDPDQIQKIQKWLKKQGLPPLEITNIKDYDMERFYDDRAVQVEPNTGRIISDLN